MRVSSTDKTRRRRRLALFAAALPLLPAGAAFADVTLPPISIGAGMRADFTHTSAEGPSTPAANDFSLDSIRLYVSGSVMQDIKFTFNTEYTGSPPNGQNTVEVMDAIARFEFSDKLNIWAGRFLPPSDRANLYGPYYANNWKVYDDGVQDGYPSVAVGRDNGVAYWGQFGILKVSAGAFDVPSTTAPSKDQSEVLSTARLQLDFWDPEAGYYLNGTYYGEKDILAVGVAGQTEADKHAYNADFLMEKKLGAAGAFGVESEYTRYDKLGGYGGYDGDYADSKGWYGLADYILPQKVGPGKVQLLGKYARATFDDSSTPDDPTYAQRTKEVEINYIVKDFNARFSLFFQDTGFDAGLPSNRQVGIGVQLQM
jgi:hypothetical protein